MGSEISTTRLIGYGMQAANYDKGCLGQAMGYELRAMDFLYETDYYEGLLNVSKVSIDFKSFGIIA